MKPLLPALDAGLLREAGFALLLRDRQPVEVADLATAIGIDAGAASSAVTNLAQAGWLDLDDSGRVVGAAGLSLSTGPHHLTLGGAPFRTWCAYDSLGIAAALGADAQVETTCGQCGAPISLAFRGGIPERAGPERLWLAEGGADLRGASDMWSSTSTDPSSSARRSAITVSRSVATTCASHSRRPSA